MLFLKGFHGQIEFESWSQIDSFRIQLSRRKGNNRKFSLKSRCQKQLIKYSCEYKRRVFQYKLYCITDSLPTPKLQSDNWLIWNLIVLRSSIVIKLSKHKSYIVLIGCKVSVSITSALLKRITDMVTTVSSLLKECFGSNGWFHWYFPDYSQKSMHFIVPLGENLAE